MSAQAELKNIIANWCLEAQRLFGENLLGVVQYGSTTKDTIKKETDVDLMLIFKTLPSRRKEIWKYLDEADAILEKSLKQIVGYKLYPSLNPKTEESLKHHSPLFLDIIEAKIIYFDPAGLIQNKIDKTAAWIKKSGAYKVQKGQLWYWVLDPNYKFGDVKEYE